MIWIILISVVVVTLLWILFAPVIIFLDTETNRYHLALPGIVKAAAVPGGDLFKVRGWVFFVPYRFDPFKKRKRQPKNEKPEKPQKKKRPVHPAKGIKLGRKILGSFRIRKLRLNIDTDDFLLNAQLIPVFSALNSGNIRMTANFDGEASLLLDMRTRLGALLWAYITTR